MVFGGTLLDTASDLSGQDYPLGVGVTEEGLEAVDEVSAVEGVAANAHTQRLPQPGLRGLVHGLVGEGAGARHDADAAGVDVSRHDADLALLRGDDAGAVRADQPALAL